MEIHLTLSKSKNYEQIAKEFSELSIETLFEPFRHFDDYENTTVKELLQERLQKINKKSKNVYLEFRQLT